MKKQASSNQKTHRQDARTVDQSASAGPDGMAIMPPAYGMDLVDDGFDGVLQTKLIVNKPGDEYEQEADRIASQFTMSPANHAVSSASQRIQRLAGQGREQRETVPPSVYEALATPGKPLESNVRQDMERHFGYDFSQVRIHTGDLAERSARDVHAHAYTVGRDIVFGPRQYALHTNQGRHVLAHELTHVVQQGGAETEGQKAEQRLQRWDLEDTLIVGAANLIGGPALGAAVALAGPSETLETVAGGLMGEFNEDPTFAMIGVDLGVSLVPILDQISDARDIIAHIYYMTVREQYNHLMRWIGLVFTLIGLFPEFGSAIKGASKFIIKGVREVISHMADILQFVRRFLPEIGDIGRLQRYVARNWDRFVAFGTAAWNRGLDRASRLLDRARTFASDFVRRMQDRLTRIREIGPTKIREAFDWVKNKIDNVLDEVAERLGLRSRQVEDIRPGHAPPPPAAAPSAATAEPGRAAAPTRGGTSFTPVPSTGTAGNRGASVRTQAERGVGGSRGPRPLPTAPRPYVRPGERALRDDFLRRFRSRQGNTWRDTGQMGHTLDRHMLGTPGSGSKFPSDWTEMDVFEAAYHVGNNPRNLAQIGRQPGMDYYRGVYQGIVVRVQVDPFRRAIHSVTPE